MPHTSQRPSGIEPPAPSGVIGIDLSAIAANYRFIGRKAPGAEVMAAVKADAYGLGVAEVAPALRDAGCRSFFVATMAEGVALRQVLPNADIYVLDGLMKGDKQTCADHRLIPVLNDLGQVERWAGWRAETGVEMPAAVHIDTGINRLGLSLDDWQVCADLPVFDPVLVMSHLACASQAGHEMNPAQLETFRRALALRPGKPASLANSAGVWLGEDYHFDAVRVGIALYGGEPLEGAENGIRPVVSLHVRILQEHMAPEGATIGYNASFTTTRPTRVATIEAGYADGLGTVFTNKGSAYIGGYRVPIIGRVSMDLITIDVSKAQQAAKAGRRVEFLGSHAKLEDQAARANTLGYELLTGLGTRVERLYP